MDSQEGLIDTQTSTLRLDTLVRLRWLAIVGQMVAVVGVHQLLDFELPLGLCLALIALSATINVILRWRYPFVQRLGIDRASTFLAYDIVQLAALLYLTGGLENPFSFLFLGPVMISATSLPPSRTFILGLLAMIAATVLAIWHLPLPWHKGETFDLPFLYTSGIWGSILLGLAFIGVYAWRVAEEARQLSRALAATELVLAREQHLSQLDGLAAAAAHQLGTPLATIALVSKELQGMVGSEGPIADDVRLLREQVERCRTILGELQSMNSIDREPFERLDLSHMLEEVVSPLRAFGVDTEVSLDGKGSEPSAPRNPGLLYGIGNIVENAVDFATDKVLVAARWDERNVTITIEDDGPGIRSEVMARLGEPYVTSRASHPAGGLGLGFFIAKTLLERSGASLSMKNRELPLTGALVTIGWPRSDFERGPG